jgi:hypothetical protein
LQVRGNEERSGISLSHTKRAAEYHGKSEASIEVSRKEHKTTVEKGFGEKTSTPGKKRNMRQV